MYIYIHIYIYIIYRGVCIETAMSDDPTVHMQSDRKDSIIGLRHTIEC